MQALRLIAAGDEAVLQILGLSLRVSGAALLLSAGIGVPIGSWLALRRFWGRKLLIAFLYTGMGFPPVVVGLLVYLVISRSGPLGWLGWLYQPEAMVAAQVIISFPLVAGLTMTAVLGVNPQVRPQVLSLGATSFQATLAILREARVGILAALVAGFGSIISEVGAVMMVGGNIKGESQVMTTAIVQLTRMGLFETAIALGLILMTVAFMVNLGLLFLQGHRLVD